MYLGDASPPGIESLPWLVAFTPARGWTRIDGTTWAPSLGDTDADVPGQQPFIAGGLAARDALQRLGYSGPIDQAYQVTISGNVTVSGGPEQVTRSGPAPALTAFLTANGYTLKTARIERDSRRYLYGSVWQGDKLLDVSGIDWSTKMPLSQKIVIGVLAAMVGGAALQAVGAIGASGAGGGAGAGAGASTAAAAAAPTVSVALPSGAVATVAKAALPIVQTLVKASTDKKAAEVASQQAQAELTAATQEQERERTALQELVQQRAALSAQQATSAQVAPVRFQPTTAADPFAASLVESSAAPRVTTGAAAARPSWLLPAAIGAAALLLLPMLTRRRKAPR